MSLTPIHPGEHLAEELQELGMSAAGLARKLNVPTNRITGTLHGQRSITGDTALRLAHFFGTTAEFWLNLQGIYDLRTAQQKLGSSLKTLPRLKHSDRIPGNPRSRSARRTPERRRKRKRPQKPRARTSPANDPLFALKPSI